MTHAVYIHIPFCAVRCGYCDFNTYTATELGGGGSQAEYAGHAVQEMRLQRAAELARGIDTPPASTVFFGGGTPTLLPVEDLVRMLDGVRETIGVADGAEVTTEANPDSLGPTELEQLAAAGFTRVSFGMQSAVPSVLKTLDRTHDPERVPMMVQAAKEAGLQVSVDLIYGTPGETLEDWDCSVRSAIAMEPHHISAYSLVIEGPTKMARQVRKREIEPVDPDTQASMYERADALLAEAGYEWYEISNFSRGGLYPCRHNLAYWRNESWWGIGPGAHGHRDGERWWNVKHPSRYAMAVNAGKLPVADSETLTAEQRLLEDVMLTIRIREGLDLAIVPGREHVVAHYIENGCLDPDAAANGRLVLTLKGRLLADGIVRDLT